MPGTVVTTNYNIAQIFLGENFYEDFTYSNSTGSPVTILSGTIVGQILATSKILPNLSSSTDGSEKPCAIYADGDIIIPDGTTKILTCCIKGRVNLNKVTFGAGDTINTAVRTTTTGGGTIGSFINALGIQLVASQELTITDPNQ